MKKYISFFIIAVVAAILGASIYKTTQEKDIENSIQQTNHQTEKQPVKLINYPSNVIQHPDFITAANKATPAVVHIKVKGSSSNNYTPLEEFFGEDYRRRMRVSGSGVIISADGYIITNNHVIEDGGDIEVVLNDKRSFDAKIIGTDPSTDLALLKIEQQNLAFLKYGNSDDVQVGEWVLAVGNPFNLTSTVTAGIVSAKGRNINILGGGANIESFIQTDAAVNPGNSGGALVNVKGDLIGINTAIASETGSFSGYSFAIPASITKKVIEDLKQYGKVQRGFLGVQIRDVNAELVSNENLKVNEGVYIPGFSPNSAAKASGIQAGDVIVKVEDKEIGSSPELQELIGRKRPGDKVKLTVNRNGVLKDYVVTLRNKTGNTELLTAPEENTESFGAVFEKADKSDLEDLGLKYGVEVSSLDSKSPLHIAGIEEGFIITKIDKTPMYSSEKVLENLKDAEDAVLIEGYYKDGQKAYYALGLEE